MFEVLSPLRDFSWVRFWPAFFGPVAVHISQVRLVFRLDRFLVFSSDTLRRVRSGVLCSGARELRCGDCGGLSVRSRVYSVRSRVYSVSFSPGEV